MNELERILRRPFLTIPASAPLAEVAGALSRTGARGAPVVDDAGVLVGFVTEHELARALGEDLADVALPPVAGEVDDEPELDAVGWDPSIDLSARDVMAPLPPSVDVREGVHEAATRMVEGTWDHLLVTREGRFLGVVTAMDVLAAVTGPARTPPAALTLVA